MRSSEPGRLVKLILPADLVRQMDRTILAANGAYQDRSEFATEAIRDRLAEDAAIRGIDLSSTPAPRSMSGAISKSTPKSSASTKSVLENPIDLGRWRARTSVSLPATPTDLVNFGLHNRDFPTLWALDWLASLTVEGPAPWSSFISRITRESVGVAQFLRGRDFDQPLDLSVGTGFPKPGAKVASSTDRFTASAIGSQKRLDGPMFVLALAAFAEPAHMTIAPTGPALTVLSEMIDRGLGPRLPQPREAFEAWWSFLGAYAPAERRAWHKILRIVQESPNRDGLVSRFPEWHGQIASTNVAGFVSRSREWGLMEPDLVDARYRLTDLGLAIAKEE